MNVPSDEPTESESQDEKNPAPDNNDTLEAVVKSKGCAGSLIKTLLRTHQPGGDAVASAVGGGGNGMASSRSLLANLQNKRMQIAASRAKPDANVQDEETKKHVALLLRIKKYMLQDLQWRGSNNKKDTE